MASLAAFAAEPAAQARLTEALADARPGVRAVAARVAFITASRQLGPKLREALATETDPEAANELIRAVVTYGGAGATADAWAAVDRLQTVALPALAEALARGNRPELLTMLPRIKGADMVNASLIVAVLARTESDPEQRKAALLALLGDGESPLSLMNTLGTLHETPPADLLAGWLRSEKPKVRIAALWWVATGSSGIEGPDPLKTLGIDVDAWRTSLKGQVTWEMLGVELLARAAGRSPGVRDWAELATSTEDERSFVLRPRAAALMHAQLKGKELKTASLALFGGNEGLADAWRQLSKTESTRKGTPPSVPMRALPAFAPGLWRDLAAMHGCELTPANAFGATVAYRPDGRPRQISLATVAVTPCSTVASTLFALSLSPDYRPASAGLIESLVLPWNKDVVACADNPRVWTRSSPSSADVDLDSSVITKPKKRQHVNPVFPMSMQRTGAEGVSLVESLMSLEGCLTDMRIVRSSSFPLLDAAALVAASQWLYEPATRNGTRVPTIMSVAVNFSLQQ